MSAIKNILEKKSYVAYFLFLVLGLSILAVLILHADAGLVVNAILKAKVYFIAVGLLFSLVNIFSKIVRWKYLCRSNEEDIKLKSCSSLYMSSLFFANITPARVGELYRPLAMKRKYKIPLSKGLAVLFFERIADLSILLFFAGLGLMLIPGLPSTLKYGAIAVLVILVLSFFFFSNISRFIKRLEWMLIKIPRIKSLDFKNLSKKLDVQIKTNLRFKPLFGLYFISFLVHLLEFLMLWVVSMAFNQNINLLMIAAILSISSIIGVLSAVPFGIGFTEASMASLFVFVGVAPEISVSITLVDRLLSLWLAMLLGIIFFVLFERKL